MSLYWQFVKENHIEYRKCIYPELLEPNSDDPEKSVCTCGHTKQEHIQYVKEQDWPQTLTSKIIWKRNTNTKTEIIRKNEVIKFYSDAFGEIEFTSRPKHQQPTKVSQHSR